jgi:hypothetical protein
MTLYSCKNEPEVDKKEIKNTTELIELQEKPIEKTDITRQYKVNSNMSIINWTGSKPAGKHNGKLSIKSGGLVFKDKDIVSGKFTVNMNSLTVLDLEGLTVSMVI